MRGIPPRTMADVSKIAHPVVHHGAARLNRKPPPAPHEGPRVAPVNKPRQWRYQTRPFFKRVRGPLVDVFNEAQEVMIIVDLGGFSRGEISMTMTPEHYIIEAVRDEESFREVIELPPNVDTTLSQERMLHGVLEIVLPRRKEKPVPKRRQPATER